jgi:hypothetical protein
MNVTQQISFMHVIDGVPSGLPDWATPSGYSIVFTPVTFSTLGNHTFQVIISDSQSKTTKNFDLEIFNTAPYFTDKVP